MSETMTPAIEGLFEQTGEGARLLGSRCATCSTPYFPASTLCHNPKCSNSDTKDAKFGPTGVLWSYSVQNYPPPPPGRYDEPYVPYALAVVDLDDGIRVVGRVLTDDPSALVAGGRVELVIAHLYTDEDGSSRSSWMFKPV